MLPTPYLLVDHLTKSVGSKTLFRDISFAVNKGQRIALIARNGIGKSTLMDILMGKTDYDSGKITWRNDLKVKYLPQILPPVEGEEHLSGGQRKRLALQRVLDDEPDMLLLDEPTNHLDLDTVVWLEDYLGDKRTARGERPLTILMVTHDRYFLDNVCTDILEIDANNLYAYHGNYAYYLEKRAERIDIMNAEADKYRNLYRTELDWMRRMPQARAHKAQYRIDNFYEIERKAKRTQTDADVRLNVQSGYIGNKIFEAHHVSKTFISPSSHEPKIILQDFNYVFSRYEKLGIIGNNGTGKSTFLKLLLGELQPDNGHFDIGTTVRFGYYAQTGLHFDDNKKVIDIVQDIAEVIDLGNGERMTASQFLQMFLFSPSQQHDFVAKLSGGERQRLHLCTVLMRNPNFLILDEPTNDLDIPTLNVLENYLTAFRGCLIVVSHDRYFMDKVVQHLFVFHGNGNIQDFPGNYTQYRQSQKQNPTNNQQSQKQNSTNNQQSPKQQPNNSPLSPHSVPNKSLLSTHSVPTHYEPSSNDYRRINAENKPHKLSFNEKRELEQLEKQIPLLEQEKTNLEAQLSGQLTSPEAIAQASARYSEVQSMLDAAELRWLELNDD